MFNLNNKRNQKDRGTNFDDYVLICSLLANQRMLNILKEIQKIEHKLETTRFMFKSDEKIRTLPDFEKVRRMIESFKKIEIVLL
jgi:hypothetical protein